MQVLGNLISRFVTVRQLWHQQVRENVINVPVSQPLSHRSDYQNSSLTPYMIRTWINRAESILQNLGHHSFSLWSAVSLDQLSMVARRPFWHIFISISASPHWPGECQCLFVMIRVMTAPSAVLVSTVLSEKYKRDRLSSPGSGSTGRSPQQPDRVFILLYSYYNNENKLLARYTSPVSRLTCITWSCTYKTNSWWRRDNWNGSLLNSL